MVANATARQTRPWNPLKLTLRVKPPQRLFDFSQRADPTPEPKVRFPNAYTFSTPPLSSLPQARKPYGPSAWHPRTTTLRQGAARRRPSSSRPDLRAMSSSPEANVHRRITNRAHDSGLHPSLFGPGSLVVTPSMVTSVQSVGCSCQNGAPARVTSWMSTRAHPIVSTIA